MSDARRSEGRMGRLRIERSRCKRNDCAGRKNRRDSVGRRRAQKTEAEDAPGHRGAVVHALVDGLRLVGAARRPTGRSKARGWGGLCAWLGLGAAKIGSFGLAGKCRGYVGMSLMGRSQKNSKIG